MKQNYFSAFALTLVTTLSAYAQVEIDQPIELTGGAGERAIHNLELPVNGTDAANKDYVDAQSGGGGLTHYIGELFDGGIVIHVFKDNLGVERGLIAALEDASAGVVWSNVENTLIGPSAQSEVNGASNIASILSQPGHTTSVAKVCDDYAGEGFTDWYAPSLYEFALIYERVFTINRALIMAGESVVEYSDYWTSTESGPSSARAFQFQLGNLDSGSKGAPRRVRCVRAF